jgi:hypothetical protein
MYLLTFYSEGSDLDKGYDLKETNKKIIDQLNPYFEKIFSFNKRTLKELPNSEGICNSYEESLDQNPNANHFGYFDFKPFIIDYTLNLIPENALLMYHDGNFEKNEQYWQSDWENIQKISNFLLEQNSSDIFVQIERNEILVKNHVKEYALDHFFNKEEKDIIKNCYLINAARFILKNTEFSRNFIKEYFNYCKDKKLISKTPIGNPDPDFKWSCGDQDILNCLIYRYILDGKLNGSFPKFSFLYRIIRLENKPFMWYDKLHPTGLQYCQNDGLLQYMSKDSLSLSDIFKKYGSDKSSDWHNYHQLYEEIFTPIRFDNINLLEVGIFKGASVRSWQEYFPKGNIYGADIDQNLFVNEGRIKSYYCNQEDSDSIKQMLDNEDLKDLQFNIIIDDGKHEFFANINFLKNAFYKLKSRGIFIIEDLTLETMNRFAESIEALKQELPILIINIIQIPNPLNNIDNNILLIVKS